MRRTDARPAAEGREIPQRPGVRPALRPESLGVGAPDGRVAVHQVSVAVHDVAPGAEDGRGARRAAAGGQDGVADAGAHGLQADRVEAMAFFFLERGWKRKSASLVVASVFLFSFLFPKGFLLEWGERWIKPQTHFR